MKRQQIIDTIKELAKSQGLYGRILAGMRELEELDPETYEKNMQFLEEQNFKDAVDLVLYFET